MSFLDAPEIQIGSGPIEREFVGLENIIDRDGLPNVLFLEVLVVVPPGTQPLEQRCVLRCRAPGAVLGPSSRCAGEQEQPAGPQHASNVAQCGRVELVMLEAFGGDDDIDALIGQAQFVPAAHQVDVSSGLKVDTEVEAVLEQILVVSVYIQRPDVEDEGLGKEIREFLLYGPTEIHLRRVRHRDLPLTATVAGPGRYRSGVAERSRPTGARR